MSNERLPGIGEAGAGSARIPTDLVLAAVLILGGFAGQTLMNRAFLLEPVAKMAALNTAQVLYGHFFGLAFLGERETFAGLAGGALVVAGAAAASLGGKGGSGGGGRGEKQKPPPTTTADVELAGSSAATAQRPLSRA